MAPSNVPGTRTAILDQFHYPNQNNAEATVTGGTIDYHLWSISNGGLLYVKDMELTNDTGCWMCVKNFISGTTELENVSTTSTTGGCIENAGGMMTVTNCTFKQKNPIAGQGETHTSA